MSAFQTWKRKLKQLDDDAPFPPYGTPFWKRFFARTGIEGNISQREPDFDAVHTKYEKHGAPLTTEGLALHSYLAEMCLRTHYGTPPCSVAQFESLAAWFHEYIITNKVADDELLTLGSGVTITCRRLRRGIALGARTVGSGDVAEMLRQLGRSSGQTSATL